MTEKRYFFHKHLRRDVIHDTLCHNWLSGEELEEHMNVQYTKYSDLKKENENLKSRIEDYDVALKKLQDLTDKKLTENEQLKQVISEFVENPIEHNLWKLRTVLKGDVK